MSKQSSVDYLIDNLYLKDSLKWKEIIEQAKAIHEEEIIDACGRFTSIFDGDINDFKEYYNETFGGNK